MATGVAIWFLFIHAPPILIQRQVYNDAAFSLHLTGAYVIYLTCIINTLFTPSTFDGKVRTYHIVLGRFGLILGVIGFLAGAYMSWWPTRENHPDLGFAIGISIGGIFQIFYQYHGYRAIKRYQHLKNMIETASQLRLQEEVELKAEGGGEHHHFSSQEDYGTMTVSSSSSQSKTESQSSKNSNGIESLEEEKQKALKSHISNMIMLFVIACGVPAWIRAAAMVHIPVPPLAIFGIAVGFAICLATFYESHIISKISGPP